MTADVRCTVPAPLLVKVEPKVAFVEGCGATAPDSPMAPLGMPARSGPGATAAQLASRPSAEGGRREKARSGNGHGCSKGGGSPYF